ncbi:MAG TPA: isoprenylcysteine carboxylmethyltransferase family protein [Phycisphaerae bacterium]|jgi:protein-S-isoprenylcysteine O-methyltransferase Ste14
MWVPGYIFERRGWIGALILFPAMLLAFLSRPRIGENSVSEIALDALAWLLLACGGGMRLWATMYIGGRKGKKLVTRGPYALCRHPLYVGSFLIILALMVLLKSLVFAGAVAVVLVAYTAFIIPSEEAYLRSIFGGEYAEYCRWAPSYLPNLRRWRRPGLARVKVSAVMLEFVRVLGCVLFAGGCETLLALRAHGPWPYLFNLP